MRVTLLGGGVLVMSALLTGCSEESAVLRGGTAASLFEPHLLSGAVLGPEGSICASLPDGTSLLVRVFAPGASSFAAIANLTCPVNTFAVSVLPGAYLIRVQLPSVLSVVGSFPVRTITETPVVIDDADVVRDITLSAGTPLGGQITFDGEPVPGAPLTLVYGDAPLFAAAVGVSGADGSWGEPFGRSPMLLQAGVRYLVSAACFNEFSPIFLGSQLQEGFPAGAFLFPAERDRLDCAVRTGRTPAFSHDRTRLVVTPMPGDIGGLSPELFDQFGAGWGVQLLGSGESPQHASITRSQLYRGGLIVGIGADRILSGIGLDGYVQCAPACRDFGMDGWMTLTSSPAFGKQVIWHYSDAGSPEAVGLKILQKSIDGAPPASYVLFKYTFTNSGKAPVTFSAGTLMDWDVGNADFDAFDDVGATERDGRLMYMTDASGSGPADGTLIYGAPVAGTSFLTSFSQPASQVVAIINGVITNPSVGFPSDHRYIHTVGPITLKPSQSRDIWMAVVAGDDLAAFHANADAATADISRRMADRTNDKEGPAAAVVWSAHASTKVADPRCKRGCPVE